MNQQDAFNHIFRQIQVNTDSVEDTVEALRIVQKLVDKATPEKVVLTTSTIRCPSCNKQLTNRGCSHSEYKYCRWCGQAIDWSGTE